MVALAYIAAFAVIFRRGVGTRPPFARIYLDKGAKRVR